MIDLSIIIVGYKNYDDIEVCITSINRVTKGVSYEIILVSNDNDQLGKLKIQSKFESVKFIGLGNNQGFSVANNVGIKHSKGKNILLLNGDTEIPDLNVLLNCIYRLNHSKEIAAAGVLQKNRLGQNASLYKSFSFRKHFFLLPPFATKYLDSYFKEPKYQDSNQVDWLSGAFLMVKKEIIEKAGLMDENFFLYAEDVEWCNRLGKFGKLIYFDDLFIYHYENENNPYRPKDQSFINKFNVQIQLSNLLWIRKQFGILSFLILIINYILIIPIIFGWKVSSNLINFRSPFCELNNQMEFTKKVIIWLSYFWDILFLKHKLYKVNKSIH